MKVTYGPKMRQSSHKTCIEDIFMSNLSNRGYLGISARNIDRNSKGIELSLAKVMNMHPNYYQNEEPAANFATDFDKIANDKETERDSGQIYTDEMKSEHDWIEEHEMEVEELENFVEYNLSNIDEDDTIAETIYKMNEQMNSVITPLGKFVASEESMGQYVREHDHLPFIMKSFEELPQAIENESQFV